MSWDQPHWSGRPPPQSAVPRQKLRPNLFARIARFSAGNALAVVLAFSVIALACAGFAVSRLAIDPDRSPRISLDTATAEHQAALEAQFPGVDQTFLAIVSGGDPETTRQQAVALAATLAARSDLFLSAFVPGTGAFYETNALLYRDQEDLRRRVDGFLQKEPLYQAMAASPDITGFAALVHEIGNAVEQGRSPPGLEAMLLTAAAAFEAQVKGQPRPVRWLALAGLDGGVEAKRWFVLATPRPGMERQAAFMAREASNGVEGVSWLWPRRALAAAPSQLRDFLVPAALSVGLTFILLLVILGSLRQATAIMLGGAVTLSAAGVVATLLGGPLDGATWSFALAVLAPAVVAGGIQALAYAQGRARGLAPLQAVMLAQHRHGGFIAIILLLFAVVWVAWLLRQLPSMSQFAIIALAGCAVTFVVSVILVPAALALLASRKAEAAPRWLDALLGESDAPAASHALDAVAMIILAAAVFSAVFLPAVRFGERQLPAVPPVLETPDARGAVHILAAPGEVADIVSRLSNLQEVGAIRTATQFLPPGAGAKITELRRLQDVTPFEPASPPAIGDSEVERAFEDLQDKLASIANGLATSPALRDAAMRLRRAVLLFANAQPLTAERVAGLERALFGGLGALSARVQKLATLPEPSVTDLDPNLLRRFISPEGIWRIEVMPRSGTGELSFAAAVRQAVPEAAGGPVVSLVRNQMIHHETLLALAKAAAAALFLVVAGLRSPLGLILALAPAIAFMTISAAVTVLLGISLNAAMLAGGSAALAVLIASSMQVARRLVGPPAAALPLRAALLAPVTLAGAVVPLAVSSMPAVAEAGVVLSLLMLIAALLSMLLVPALARWLAALAD
jgi:hypothetical protein